MNFTQLSSPATDKHEHFSFDYRRFNRSGVSFSTGVHIKRKNQVSHSSNCPKVNYTANLVSWNTGAWFVAYKWLTFQWAQTRRACLLTTSVQCNTIDVGCRCRRRCFSCWVQSAPTKRRRMLWIFSCASPPGGDRIAVSQHAVTASLVTAAGPSPLVTVVRRRHDVTTRREA